MSVGGSLSRLSGALGPFFRRHQLQIVWFERCEATARLRRPVMVSCECKFFFGTSLLVSLSIFSSLTRAFLLPHRTVACKRTTARPSRRRRELQRNGAAMMSSGPQLRGNNGYNGMLLRLRRLGQQCGSSKAGSCSRCKRSSGSCVQLAVGSLRCRGSSSAVCAGGGSWRRCG